MRVNSRYSQEIFLPHIPLHVSMPLCYRTVRDACKWPLQLGLINVTTSAAHMKYISSGPDTISSHQLLTHIHSLFIYLKLFLHATDIIIKNLSSFESTTLLLNYSPDWRQYNLCDFSIRVHFTVSSSKSSVHIYPSLLALLPEHPEIPQ